MKHVLLFTTCDFGSGRLDEFERLTRSLTAAAQQGPVSFIHLVLMQRASDAELAPLALQSLPFRRVLLRCDGRVSLAAARNVLLRTAQKRGLLSAASWVAFPDDDAWYPTGLVQAVDQAFGDRPGLSMLTCHYGSQPRPSNAGAEFVPAAAAGKLVPVFSSNTLFARASAVLAAGVLFDERLGLGAAINGGEDLDYALRLLATPGATVAYCPDVRVGHRDRLAWVRSRYFEGSLCALARGAALQRSLRLALLRKVLVGLALVAKRELPWGRYRKGLGLARAFWRGAHHVHADEAVMQKIHSVGTPVQG